MVRTLQRDPPDAVGIRLTGTLESGDFDALRTCLDDLFDTRKKASLVLVADDDRARDTVADLWARLDAAGRYAHRLDRIALVGTRPHEPRPEEAPVPEDHVRCFPDGHLDDAWRWVCGR